MTVFEMREKFDEWVILNIGAGSAMLVAVLSLIALIVCFFYIHSEKVEIETIDDHTEAWHYKGETVIVDKSETVIVDKSETVNEETEQEVTQND